MTNQERARKLAQRIANEVMRGAGRGLDAGRAFLTARVKEALSVPAPRKRVVSSAGDISYRATTAAVPGAPPRKLSGRLRSSVTSKLVGWDTIVIGVNAKSAKGFSYPKYHEIKDAGQVGSGKHPFLKPTLAKYRSEMLAILARGIKEGFAQ